MEGGREKREKKGEGRRKEEGEERDREGRGSEGAWEKE